MEDDLTCLARECEANMINKIESDPKLLHWLVNYTPDHRAGFMYSDHPNINKIAALVHDDGHSGASFGLCLRSVQHQLRNKH